MHVTKLRQSLVTGDLDVARRLLAELPADQAELGPAFSELIEGVAQVRHGGRAQAAEQLLQRLSGVQAGSPDVRWLAWLWRATALVRGGQLDVARTAADLALTIARQVDPASQAVTLALRAAVASLQGDFGHARVRVVEAAALSAHDPVAVARLWLFWGQVMLATGRQREGLRALGQAALAVRQPWACVPLGRQALMANRIGEADEIFAPMATLGLQLGDDVGCLLDLVGDLHAGRIGASVVGEYLWTTAQALTPQVAALAESLVEEQSGYARLRLLLAWDLAQAGLFDRALQQLGAITAASGGTDESVRNAARRSVSAVEALRGRWHQGVLDVVRVAAWALAGGRSSAGESTQQDGELFWIRRAIGAGQLDRAEEDLELIPELDETLLQQERELLQAVRSGAIPFEVAQEYVWIAERLLTEEQLGLVRAFAEENRSLETLRLVMARDLLREGFRPDARSMLEELAQRAQAEATRLAARRELQQLVPARLTVDLPATLDLAMFVKRPLPWPSVLDRSSLLFCGPLLELPLAVAEVAETIVLEAGETLHAQGGRGEILYLLRHGELDARRVRGALTQELGPFGAGSFLGEIGTLYGMPNTATLTAAVACEIGVIKRRSLRQATERAATTVVMETLRQLYWDTALHLCPLTTPTDEQWISQLALTEGRSRIFRPGELLSIEPEAPLAILISGVGRVMAAEHGGATLGFAAPGDLVLNAAAPLLRVRAETVLSLAVVSSSDLARLSPGSLRALEEHLGRCLAAMQAVGVLTEDEHAKIASQAAIADRLRTLAQCVPGRPADVP